MRAVSGHGKKTETVARFAVPNSAASIISQNPNMAYYYRKEVHQWFIQNLTPKEMKHIVHRRLPYIRDCIARQKFPHKMLYELLVAKPCPLVAPDDMPNPDALLWKKKKERPADVPAFMGGIPPPPEPP